MNSALIATGPASHHATAWTRPVVQAELNQRGIRRGDGVGIAVQGARHCQDLLRVHDDQQAVAHNRPDLGGFFKISLDLNVWDCEFHSNAPPTGFPEIGLDLAEERLVGGEDHDLLPSGGDKRLGAGDNIGYAFHDVRDVRCGRPGRGAKGLQEDTEPSCRGPPSLVVGLDDPTEANLHLFRRHDAIGLRLPGSNLHETFFCASDYSADELARIPAASVLGLGSGNPVRAADLHPGETVVDLGSGGGIDVFLAASVVGAQGRAIGVDMTPAMVDRARDAARSPRAPNTSFVLAPIERIPLAANIADVVLSNCVINLSPDKPAVFAEAFRILKPGGRLAISDIVQERDLGKIEDDCGCVATAMVRAEYLNTIRDAGFRELHIAEDRAWRTGPNGVEASAVTLVARKPDGR